MHDRNLFALAMPLALLVSTAGAQQRPVDQDAMKANYEAMLGHDWYVDGGWTTDFGAAKARAAETGLPIFAYFTRTYAP